MFSSTSWWASPFLNVSARMLSACFSFHPLCIFLSLSVRLSFCLSFVSVSQMLLCIFLDSSVLYSVCLFVSLSLCLFVCKCGPLCIFSIRLSFCLSVVSFSKMLLCIFLNLSVCYSVCLYVCVLSYANT